MGSLREVRITAVFLNSEDRILIHFPPDPQLEKLVCQLPGCSWSDSFNGWHIRNNPANLRLIFRTFRGIASIDKSGVFGPKSVVQKIIKDATAKRNKIPHPSSISEAPSRKIEEFHLWLMQQRYSENTIKTYVDGISTFLRYYAGKIRWMNYLKTVADSWVRHSLQRYNPTYIMNISQPGWDSKTLGNIKKDTAE